MANSKESLLQRLQRAVQRRTINSEADRSIDWFRAQLQNFAVYSRQQADGNSEIKRYKKTVDPESNTSLIGSMFTYAYDPKHKDFLPFYDIFPLTILVGPADKGFYGLNIHYLPPVLRAKFLDGLLEVLTTDRIQEGARFRITYNMLKAQAKYKYFKPCFKHYLTDHLKSPVKLIQPNDWIRAIFLNSAQFKKASVSEVYKWSKGQL